ncbi:MAG: DMT family transporter [Lachnospiraceae bacterium]|nr:DMT family transporter [Lachnospiraceae bacterium]
MIYALLIISILMSVLKNILSKYGDAEFEGVPALFKLNSIIALSTTVMALIMGGHIVGSLNTGSIILCIVNAVTAILAQVFFIKSVATGSVTVSSLFYACGFIIPTIWGAAYYQEEIGVLQIACLLVLCFSLWLGTQKEENGEKGFSVKWLVLALLAMFFSGVLGVLQKIFSMSEQSHLMNDYLATAFSMMFLLTLVVYVFSNKGFRKSSPKFYTLAVLMGIATGLINMLNIFLAGKLPSIIVFPATNGGIIVATALASAIVFREKLSSRQKLSIILGVVSIIVIGVC